MQMLVNNSFLTGRIIFSCVFVRESFAFITAKDYGNSLSKDQRIWESEGLKSPWSNDKIRGPKGLKMTQNFQKAWKDQKVENDQKDQNRSKIYLNVNKRETPV